MTSSTGPVSARVLGGRYSLGATLGIGGMAQVFAGTDLRLGRPVAVKVLRTDLARDPALQQRFRREAQAAALLNDPAIVAVYDTGEDLLADDEHVPWIVMERVQGATLREVLQQHGPMPPVQALRVVAEVCRALEVAHEAGIVHRDIKPGNVMLADTGEVKVMDFGIARAVSGVTATMTQTATVVGTAAYLSPEQARGDHVDARSDLYSAGCLLYELLTGRAPFTGDSLVAVAYQHVREDPRPPSVWAPSMPSAVDAVVLKAMAKDPAQRYQTAGQMRDELLRAAAGQPVEAPRVPFGSQRAVQSQRTRRRVLTAAFVLVLLALAGGVGLGVRSLLGQADSSVRTPSVIGLTLQQAQARLEQDGLVVGRVRPTYDTAPVNQVLDQSPPSGTDLPRGRDVDLVVSQGVEKTRVPQVVGLPQDDATAQVSQAKLVLGKVVPRDGPAPAGQVLEVVPAAGTPLDTGQQVTLVVASGQSSVPRVVRLPVAQATAALQAAGLSAGVQLRDDPGPPGIVLSQDPASGTLPRGSTVTIVVSQAPPAPPPSQTPSPTPSTTPSSSPSPSPSPSETTSGTPSPSPTR